MTFNAREVAERVQIGLIRQGIELTGAFTCSEELITKHLEEAHAAGLKEGLSCPGKEIEEAYKRGVADENAACAKIVSDWHICGPDGPRLRSGSLIVDVIRQRLKEKLG